MFLDFNQIASEGRTQGTFLERHENFQFGMEWQDEISMFLSDATLLPFLFRGIFPFVIYQVLDKSRNMWIQVMFADPWTKFEYLGESAVVLSPQIWGSNLTVCDNNDITISVPNMKL